MKKLTAGIFTVLMGLVSVNAADAAVASKGYVDNKFFTIEAQTAHVAAQKATDDAQNANINKNTADIETLTSAYQTADNALSDRIDQLTGGGATKSELSAAIEAEVARSNKYTDDAVAEEVTRADLAYDVKGAAATAQSAAETTAKSYTDAEVKELADGAVATNTAAIAAINSETNGILKQANNYTDAAVEGLASGAVATNTAAITILDGDVTVEGSVKKQIKDASDATKTAYDAADAATLEAAKGYTDEQIEALDLQAISRVPAACGTKGNYCVLTTNGTNFVWEVIVREDTTLDQGDDGLYEPTVTQ